MTRLQIDDYASSLKRTATQQQNDRDHQGLGEMPGVVLREGEVVRHLKLPSLRGDHPRSTGAGRVRISAAVTSKAKP
jgi:hypothetical protein